MQLMQTAGAMGQLRERLAGCPLVSQYGPEESEILVQSFSDLEASFRVFLDEQLPKLADPNLKGEQLEDLLMEIQGEFQHILYHIHDPKFFRVVEPTHEWLVLAEAVQK